MQESISASKFTAALSLAANGVSIVTTNGRHGKAGLTVSSMCSVCAEPALVLACVNADNEFCTKADENQCFAINILTSEQQKIANTFAGIEAAPNDDRFSIGQWLTLETGSPNLSDALVTLDCTLVSAETHGTHRIYIGQVVAVTSSERQPLIYSNRGYATAQPFPTQ